MKKVVSILGSPRIKGSSSRIAASFTEEAKRLGADIEIFPLNSMKYRGCQGCEACHTKLDHCAFEDDGKKALDSMRTADVMVLASPVYLGDISGQLKLLMDRTWSHVAVDYSKDYPFVNRIPEGKVAVLILSQASDENTHLDVVERYTETLAMLGFDVKVLRATGQSMEVENDVSVIEAEASALARMLCGASSG